MQKMEKEKESEVEILKNELSFKDHMIESHSEKLKKLDDTISRYELQRLQYLKTEKENESVIGMLKTHLSLKENWIKGLSEKIDYLNSNSELECVKYKNFEKEKESKALKFNEEINNLNQQIISPIR
jgi:hypothetical protein